MGKSAPKAPAAPDPAATSAAQTQSNKETALYNFGLSNQNWSTPLGNLQYTLNMSDPNQPQASGTVTLSPEQQQLYNQQTQQSIALSNLANQLQGRVGDYLSAPVPGSADFNAQAKQASDAYYNNQKQYLDPQFQQQQQSLDSQLANEGITRGNQAYQTAQDNFARQKQSAYDTAQNNAILQGPQNAQQLFALSSAARELPLNEFNALRSQSQVQMPTFQQSTPVGAQGTNVAGNINTAYGQQLNAYNQQLAGNNNITSGLFGLAGAGLQGWAGSPAGSAAIGSFFSDTRLKTAVKRHSKIGSMQIYSFKYLGDDTVYTGVMAQDIIKTHPWAVMHMDNGYMAVDYGALGIQMERLN